MRQARTDKPQHWRNETDKELEEGLLRGERNHDVCDTYIIEELRYRQQKRLATWVAWLVGGTLFINLIGIAVTASINLR